MSTFKLNKLVMLIILIFMLPFFISGGLDQHTTVLIIISVIVICVLLIILSLIIYIICRYSRNSHRQSQKIQSVASYDDASVVKVNTKYVRDERKPKHDAGEMKNQRKFQRTAGKGVNDYEPLKDNPHVYSHLHRSLVMENEIATLVEVHADANSKSLENKGQDDDEIRLITSTLDPDKGNKDFKETLRSKSHYESISEDAEIDNIRKAQVYIDMSGTAPKSVYHKMDRQSCLQSGSIDSNSKPQRLTFPMTPKQSDSKEKFTTVPNVNSLYENIRSNDDDDDNDDVDDDDDGDDKDHEYVDIDADGPKYPSVGSIVEKKTRTNLGSFYTNKHGGTKRKKKI
ncbi:hypothetical protein ACF0H5_007168 [Mactra antiquata]